MNYRIIARTLGTMCFILSCCMVPSAAIAMYCSEFTQMSSFLLVAFMLFLAGACLKSITKKTDNIRLREGYLIVVLTWFTACVFCSLPYYISGAIPDFADAIFESTSGITTTGSSILTDIEAMPKSMLFWRSFTHWMGGLGILTMAIAILPALGIGGFQMARAEASNSNLDKTAPKMADMAKILYKTYFSLTAICIILLLLGGMGLFDAVNHAFSVIATGGFSTRNLSIGYFNSAYIEAVLSIFMVIGSISFPILYSSFSRRSLRSLLKNDEIRCFIIILLIGCFLVSGLLIFTGHASSPLEAVRLGFFHVTSLMTTTGFSAANYNVWPVSIIVILLVWCFMGGCSGSTTGGVRAIRVLTTLKLIRTEFKKKLHPKAVYSIKLKNLPVSYDTSISAVTYIIFYFMIAVVGCFIVALSADVDFVTAFSASFASMTNTGPGFGLVGPDANYSIFADWIKILLSFIMVVGKLEIFAIFMLFTPSFWNPDRHR